MEAMGTKGEQNYLEAKNEVLHAFADHSKAKEIFKINDTTNLLAGLSKMAAWVKENGVKQSQVFKNIEIEKNLPKSWKE